MVSIYGTASLFLCSGMLLVLCYLFCLNFELNKTLKLWKQRCVPINNKIAVFLTFKALS